MCSQVDRCRLDIGHFELETVGSIVSGTMRINLFDANVTGTLVTTKGRVSFTTLTFSSEHVFLIDLMPEGEEADLRIRYVAEHGICNGRYLPDTYIKNPAPECFTTREKTHNYHVCQHRLLEQGDYAEAYTIGGPHSGICYRRQLHSCESSTTCLGRLQQRCNHRASTGRKRIGAPRGSSSLLAPILREELPFAP